MSDRHLTRIGLVLAICTLALVGNTWAGKPNKPRMHVENIDLILTTQGELLWTATAEILIYDQSSNPIAEATVTGDWDLDGSILSSGASAVTDNGGIAMIAFGPQNASAGQTFTFTVTNVKLRGLTYDRPGIAPAGSIVVPGEDTTSPMVNSVIPADGATGVSVSTAIEVVFSEPIDPGTLAGNFIVNDGTADISGSIQSSDNPSVTFVPQTNLAENTTYTVTVVGGETGVKDPSGNPLDSNFNSSFTTGNSIPPLEDQDYRLSNNGNYFPEPDIFSRTETLYVQVRSDNIDHSRLKKSEVRLNPWGTKFPLVYNTSGPQSGTYTGSRSLSDAPAGEITVQIVIEDRSRNKYNATATITIDGTVDEVSYPFPGIKRTHRITNVPRPLNINVLEVTLSDPGINLFVSPGNPNSDGTVCTEAVLSKTTTFVGNYELQVGINGDFSNLDPPEEPCEPVANTSSVNGLGVSYRSPESGYSEIPRDLYSSDNGYPALAFTESSQPYIGRYDADSNLPFSLNNVYNAVGGNKMLVADGAAVDPSQWDRIGGALEFNPRTSVGLSSDENTLIIIVIDGRKTGFSEGVTLPEMSEYLIEFGAHTGLNLDGGGSSTMVFGTSTGPEIINYPSDGTERPRPNHLGIYASSSASSPLALSQFQPRQEVQTPALYQNYPNPFNPETWVPFTLSADAHVTIRIYSVGGQLIRALDLGYKPTGMYISREKAAYWDGKNEMGESAANGIYFYNIQAGDYTATRKMIVSK